MVFQIRNSHVLPCFLCLFFNPCVICVAAFPGILSQRQHLGWPPELSHFHSQVPRGEIPIGCATIVAEIDALHVLKKTLSFLFLFVLEVPTHDWTGSGIFFNGSISFGVIDRQGWYSVGSHIPGIVGNPKPGEHLRHCMYINTSPGSPKPTTLSTKYQTQLMKALFRLSSPHPYSLVLYWY